MRVDIAFISGIGVPIITGEISTVFSLTVLFLQKVSTLHCELKIQNQSIFVITGVFMNITQMKHW